MQMSAADDNPGRPTLIHAELRPARRPHTKADQPPLRLGRKPNAPTQLLWGCSPVFSAAACSAAAISRTAKRRFSGLTTIPILIALVETVIR